MGKAKDIVLRPISSAEANAIVKKYHYSGKVVQNSQLHIGVYYQGKLEGAMQFGPSLDKRKIMGLVKGTGWNEFLELNRMAFSDTLPRNSESRALTIAMKLIKKYAPHIKWIVSFADGTQCGDGTMYRAAGFVLTGIKKNNQIWEAPRGARESRTSLTDGTSKRQQTEAVRLCRGNATKGGNILDTGGASMRSFVEAGFQPLNGFQLWYIYFIDQGAKENLTVPILPFSDIERRGARMYKGVSCVGSIDSDALADQARDGDASSTPTLQNSETTK